MTEIEKSLIECECGNIVDSVCDPCGHAYQCKKCAKRHMRNVPRTDWVCATCSQPCEYVSNRIQATPVFAMCRGCKAKRSTAMAMPCCCWDHCEDCMPAVGEGCKSCSRIVERIVTFSRMKKEGVIASGI